MSQQTQDNQQARFKADRTELLDMLTERGYEFNHGPYADGYTLTAGDRSVRVAAWRDEDQRAGYPASLLIAANGQNQASRWSVKVQPGMPLSVMLALVDAAEAELSAGVASERTVHLQLAVRSVPADVSEAFVASQVNVTLGERYWGRWTVGSAAPVAAASEPVPA
jgi:hypothetical protein